MPLATFVGTTVMSRARDAAYSRHAASLADGVDETYQSLYTELRLDTSDTKKDAAASRGADPVEYQRAVGVDGVRCQSSSSRSGSNDASTASRSRVDLSVPPYKECRCRDASSSAAAGTGGQSG